MHLTYVSFAGRELPLYTAQALVIGSGCAGYNALIALTRSGVDAAMLTENVQSGTSRNAGSDKQTYYKLSLASPEPDSVYDLASTLAGPDADGDTALVQAANSVRGFMHLAERGVPFPVNEYGEYVGYKTDHDPRFRATSAGPLTSRLMTEALEKEARENNCPVLDHMLVFRILTLNGRAAGCLALDQEKNDYVLFSAPAIVIATGGPACVYSDSVFPISQHGMTGVAMEAGCAGQNLHLWQYGLASTLFRWNVSGSYQQVLPRYTDENGREFLNTSLGESAALSEFLKGYEWPFDVRKVNGSSRVDLLVHALRFEEGHRAYMDYRRDPSYIEKNGLMSLPDTARTYLENSGALLPLPIERLRAMNEPAIDLYLSHGIDLSCEPLEIAVCAQHHNGGLAVDASFRTTVPGIYAAGEAAGTFGAYRPGGSALNASQAGSLAAARAIAREKSDPFAPQELFLRALSEPLPALGVTETDARGLARDMSRCAAHMRSVSGMTSLLSRAGDIGGAPLPALPYAGLATDLLDRDQVLATRAILRAMLYSARHEGSRGSGLVDGLPAGECGGVLMTSPDGACSFRAPRPMPEGDQWFERVWKKYRSLR